MIDSAPHRTDWPHAPVHIFVPRRLYIVTAATLGKAHLLNTHARLFRMVSLLHEVFPAHGWELRAWAVLSNHYHVIALSSDGAPTLSALLQNLHSVSSKELNELDGTPGRKTWYQFRDTCLTHQRSYFARLNYVNQNAVKHNLVRTATEYPYCSARHFADTARPAFVKSIARFKWDKLNEPDDFEPILPEE